AGRRRLLRHAAGAVAPDPGRPRRPPAAAHRPRGARLPARGRAVKLLPAVLSAPVVAAALTGAACTSEPGPYHPSVPPEAASRAAAPTGDIGRVLYLRDCAWCHGGSAEGTPRAPDLRQAPRGAADVDFVLRTRRMPLRKPEDPMRRGAATTVYSAADRAAIVGYLRR